MISAAQSESCLLDSDKTLIERVKSGDSMAFEELFVKYKDRVFTTAYHLCNFDREAALDLTQDTFIRVFEKLYQFDGRCKLFTWIYRITITIFLKKRKRQKLLESLASFFGKDLSYRAEVEPSQMEHLMSKEFNNHLREAMRKLSARQELIFKLKFLDELTIREISEVTGITEGSVKVHLFRALKTIRDELKDWVP